VQRKCAAKTTHDERRGFGPREAAKPADFLQKSEGRLLRLLVRFVAKTEVEFRGWTIGLQDVKKLTGVPKATIYGLMNKEIGITVDSVCGV
jgi:hypothetical protein